MTPEAQRIAIAEACPNLFRVFHFDDRFKLVWKKDWTNTGQVDPLSDLNVMHEVESSLTVEAQNDYYGCLLDIARKSERWNHIEYETIHATAAQRAEAFLRTIGKWTE